LLREKRAFADHAFPVQSVEFLTDEKVATSDHHAGAEL